MRLTPRTIARDEGRATYSTGKACLRGHDAERSTAGGECLACYSPERRAALTRARYRRDPSRAKAYSVAYRKNNLDAVKARLRIWAKKRRKIDIQFRISAALRRRLNKAVRGVLKGGSAVSDLGCSIKHLITWIECRFTAGMSWDNYGPVWHIDHKIPLSGFDLTDPAQVRAACHYTNLQPMFAGDNIRKGGVRMKLMGGCHRNVLF